jgi:hypothetical protein
MRQQMKNATPALPVAIDAPARHNGPFLDEKIDMLIERFFYVVFAP